MKSDEQFAKESLGRKYDDALRLSEILFRISKGLKPTKAPSFFISPKNSVVQKTEYGFAAATIKSIEGAIKDYENRQKMGKLTHFEHDVLREIRRLLIIQQEYYDKEREQSRAANQRSNQGR